MATNKEPTKEQILKAIENLEKNPNDKLNILTNIGIFGVGAAGAGYAASILGASALFFGLLPVTAPLAVVVGGAALGGAALVGVKRMFEGNFDEGKRQTMLEQLKQQKKEIEAKERASEVEEIDKTKFIVCLKEPVKLNLISPKDAQQLIAAVESGQMPIKEAIKMVQDVVEAAKV